MRGEIYLITFLWWDKVLGRSKAIFQHVRVMLSRCDLATVLQQVIFPTKLWSSAKNNKIEVISPVEVIVYYVCSVHSQLCSLINVIVW